MVRTEEEIYQEGIHNFRAQALGIANIRNDAVYRQFFGLSPELTNLVWDLLSSPTIHSRFLPKHLLWALMFLKQYANEGVLSGLAKVTPKTFHKWVWIVIYGLCSRYENFVSERLLLFYLILSCLILFIFIIVFYLLMHALTYLFVSSFNRLYGIIGISKITGASARSL